jgi:ferritin
MLSQPMEEALNEQINAELYSGYLYMAMSAYFQKEGLPGFATWMHAQAQEEQFHAEKFYNFIHERDGRVVLKTIEAPPADWDSPLSAFQDALAHEQKVTDRINKLMDLAMEQKDHATRGFLQWFVDEQVEEEDSVRQVIDELKLVGATGGGMFMLNRELGQRSFSPPAEGE